MTNYTTIYKTEPYNKSFDRLLIGVYNDFRNCAEKDYNFELEPLSFENFVKSLENGLLNCIVLFEDSIPTGFLVYTTLISNAIELNIIHCLGNENLNQKRKLLLEKFIELNKNLMKEKEVTYPMLGKQSDFEEDISIYGFKTVNTSVMRFNLTDIASVNKVKNMNVAEFENDYSIGNWKHIYTSEAVDIIRQAFKNSSDALFDSRFTNYKGCSDIVRKITDNIYGEFLPEITKVLLYKKRPVGICFANKTNDKIANIPITAILKKHREKGYSKILLKHLLSDLINYVTTDENTLKEINASCDSDNKAALRMYKSAGFKEDYTYPLAYHPGLG